MSSGRDSRRGSRANNVAENSYKNSERRDKAKSTQYTGSSSRRSSLKPLEAGVESTAADLKRPALTSRTNSAPLVERRRGSGYDGGMPGMREEGEDAGNNARVTGHRPPPVVTTRYSQYGQDEDEVAGVVGAVRQYEPFRSPDLAQPLTEINIAVVGAENVGKTTFMQRAMDLPMPASQRAIERQLPYDGTVYLVRLLEIPIDDVEIDEDDDAISWPQTIAERMMPKVDGVLTLYDVKDRSSVEYVPETLSAISKAPLPSILISCKCDTPIAEREVAPAKYEIAAKQKVGGLHTLQTSPSVPESYRNAVFTMVKAVVHGANNDRSRASSTNRRRAQSNAIRPVSPRPPAGHARASSEYAMSLNKDKAAHSRHDPSLAGYGHDRLRVPGEASEEPHNTFFFEGSETDSVSESAESSYDDDRTPPTRHGAAQPAPQLSENGATFDQLVDRLLAKPISKADEKFVVIFLALYRKFAAPGRLLEAVVDRYNALDQESLPAMMKTVARLRFLTVMDQWISHYPGDFAYQKTRRRVRMFIAKISTTSIYHVAGKEMSTGLESVHEDDDTNWACTDKDREAGTDNSDRWTMTSVASTLIDDENFIYPDNVSIGDDVSTTITAGADTIRSTSASSTTSSQLMQNVEAAQRQAQSFVPRPTHALTKIDWRMLMEYPDETIAKELTRMDWIMFSSIRPRDLVRHVSLKANKTHKWKNLVNVDRMIAHFNHLAAWVKNYILLRDKPKHRALMLEKMMKVARKLRELNNYNAVGAFIAGIRSSSVGRLQASRDLIPASAGKDWSSLEILMSPSRSHGAYRTAWENSASERIPYIPLHRRDLVSAEEGNKTFLGDENGADSERRINWRKFEVMGEVIVSLQRAQGVSYRGLSTPHSGEQIRKLVLEGRITNEEEELYERSVLLEPTNGQTGSKIKDFFRGR
nr:hypothetical protein B0A51_04355 [Rachicladosporium sp. CCFEE 5018]